MADYEYKGLRQAILKNPDVPLDRLEMFIKHEYLLEEIKKYEGQDVAAIYAAEHKNFKKSDTYSNLLIVRGKLLGAIANELQFAGADGGKTAMGAEYKGTSWILLMNNLVDVVPFDEVLKNHDPFKKNNPLALFKFNTMYDIDLGTMLAHDPINAHNVLIESNQTYMNDLARGVTLPIKLVGITPSDYKSGTGTGTGR